MYSLAVLVLFLIFTCAFSGPIALLLSSKKLRSLTERTALTIIRRAMMAIINFFGIVVCVFFLSAQIPFLFKAVALASLLLNLFAIDREYGARVATYLKKSLKRDSHGTVGQS